MKILDKKIDFYLTECFKSVQGESSLAGLPTTFIRLSGCNLRCSWCDTSYSFKRGERWSLEQIKSQVESFGAPYVCITGGEPLLQAPVHLLMSELCDLGYLVSIETGGSLPIDPIDPRVHIILDVKCPQSGMHEKNHLENLSKLKSSDEIKFVIADRNDYDFAKSICDQYQLYRFPLLFSPVFGKMDPQCLVSWILEDNLKVRLNLQQHKYIWHPEQKGV